MASRACSSWLEDNIVVSSIQLGRRALQLYCHNCASVYEWRVVAARAPHHRIRAMPAEPKQRKCQGRQVEGPGAAPYVSSYREDCTRHRRRAGMGVNPVEV